MTQPRSEGRALPTRRGLQVVAASVAAAFPASVAFNVPPAALAGLPFDEAGMRC